MHQNGAASLHLATWVAMLKPTRRRSSRSDDAPPAIPHRNDGPQRWPLSRIKNMFYNFYINSMNDNGAPRGASLKPRASETPSRTAAMNVARRHALSSPPTLIGMRAKSRAWLDSSSILGLIVVGIQRHDDDRSLTFLHRNQLLLLSPARAPLVTRSGRAVQREPAVVVDSLRGLHAAAAPSFVVSAHTGQMVHAQPIPGRA
jgi:hypothetical protein